MPSDDFLDWSFEEEPAPEGLGIFTTSFWGDMLNNRNAEAFEFLKANEAQTEAYIDQEGYTWLIIAFVINEAENCCAWVEWKSNTNKRIEEHDYFLKARLADGRFLKWSIQTYNNYFGCSVLALSCHQEGVSLNYQDKHDTYSVFLDQDNQVVFGAV